MTLTWFDSFYVHVSTMMLVTVNLTRSTLTNGHRFTTLGLP